MRISIILFLVFISVADCFCQNRNSVWCFGDSAGIDFSTPFPSTFQSGLDVRGSCTSIADTSGNLLFYASTSYKPYYWLGVVPLGAIYSKAHTLMQNGDSLIGRGWYNEIIIVPNPADTNMYYTFSCGHSDILGFYYSKIDLSQNGGLGVVTQKNAQLQTFRTADCVSAIKHGNGRDWWIIFRNIGALPNNDFYEYLVSPNGISNVQISSAGTLNNAGFVRFCVNSEGNKLAVVNVAGLVEVYDFNRCDGTISNARTIEIQQSSPPAVANWECAFSPNSNLLYVTTDDYECVLLQYNLLDSNPSATKDTLWDITFPVGGLGAVRRAPDNKLYVSCAYIDSMGTWNYPYSDSVYNMYNMNLSVINSPDSVGAACNFQPYSFYLGGKRTYWGLPNNPDYNLPRDSGSACDTIQWTSIQNIEQAKGLMYVTYISSWQKLFVNAQGLKGRSYKVSVYDMVGNVIYTEEGKLSAQYFTRDLNMAAFAKGMYIVNFVTDKERLVKKFIKD